MNSFSAYDLNLFRESDYLSLSPRLSIHRGYLVDTVTGGRHRLHYLADSALRRLVSGVVFHKWLLYMLDEQLSNNEINDIILFLNNIGGFQVRTTNVKRLMLFRDRWRMYLRGFRQPKLTMQHQASLNMLMLATIRAMASVAVAVFAVVLLLVVSGFSNVSTAAELGAMFLITLFTSTVIHELSHLYFVRKGRQPVVIIQGGWRLALLHGPLPITQELACLLAGPLNGLLSSLLVGMSLLAFSRPAFLVIGVLVGLFHLVSLWPSFSDGRSLVRLTRSFR